MKQQLSDEHSQIQIVDYEEKYRDAFKSINVQWISQYFEMEASDYKALDHPDTYILDGGGIILVALFKEEAVGVCALIKMEHEHYDFELAKMGVSPKARGKGVGYLIGKAILERAQQMGAKKVYLESNSILEPAINLYRKLGFAEVTDIESPYQRCDIQMGISL